MKTPMVCAWRIPWLVLTLPMVLGHCGGEANGDSDAAEEAPSSGGSGGGSELGGSAGSESSGAGGLEIRATGGAVSGATGGESELGGTGGTPTGGSETGGVTIGGFESGGTSGGFESGGSGDGSELGGFAGSELGGTGGSELGGTGGSTGGDGGRGGSAGSSGGTGDCIDVCTLYGAPCCVSGLDCVTPGSSCVIDVFEQRFTAAQFDYSDLEAAVASIPQDIAVSFTDTDIAWAAVESSPSPRIELRLTPEASSQHETIDRYSYVNHPFRISCDGQSLFLGVFRWGYEEQFVGTPVLHVARDSDDTLILYLGAWQTAWMFDDDWIAPDETEILARIDRSELRAVFCQRGALRERSPDDEPIGL